MRNKKQILGIRASEDFIVKFDTLCADLGFNRSSVIRYCLKRFLSETAKGTNSFEKAKSEMY